MNGEKIYTGAEALALREAHAEPCDDCDGAGHYLCPDCGEDDGEPCEAKHDDARHVRCDVCRGRGWVESDDVGPVDAEMVVDLAASVAHWEARAKVAEAERERLLPRKGEHVNELYACVARVLCRLGVQDHGGDPLEALESWADEEHARSLAETDALNAIIAERGAAIAHAEELTRALAAERAARVRAEAEVDGRGRDLAAVARERDGLRAIVEGRAEPPTREECAAHEAVGGWWLVLRAGGLHAMPAWARHYADMRHWWAIDPTGRLCAWPTTEAPRG